MVYCDVCAWEGKKAEPGKTYRTVLIPDSQPKAWQDGRKLDLCKKHRDMWLKAGGLMASYED